MQNSNLNSLYREIIMDHYKNPRNKGLQNGLNTVHLKNPTCGDDVAVQIKINNGIIEDVFYDGTGCSISMSACSVMSETVKGKSVEDAKKMVANYVNMAKGEPMPSENIDMGDAVVYAGVADFPARFKCATIAWEALLKAIETLEKQEKE